MPIVRLEPGDVRALAEVIYGEARGDGWCSMVAVGWVVVNRLTVDPETWGTTLSRVIAAPHQFSSYHPKRRKQPSDAAFYQAQAAAFAVLQGAPDPTKGATHFHHITIKPGWTRRLLKTARIGSHFFYK